MRNCFKFLLLTVIIISSYSITSAQELVKPVENKSVRKAEIKNLPSDNVNANSGTSYSGGNSKIATDSTSRANNVSPNKVGTVSSNPENATRDNDQYQSFKIDWIKNNPEKFKKFSGNPNLIILTEQELNSYSETEQARILADEINYLIIR